MNKYSPINNFKNKFKMLTNTFSIYRGIIRELKYAEADWKDLLAHATEEEMNGLLEDVCILRGNVVYIEKELKEVEQCVELVEKTQKINLKKG